MEGTVWNKLPDDLQILVLLHLPLLDLRRFSLTCNYFHSLLSDPSFAIHYDRHRLAHTAFVASLPLQNGMQTTVIWQQVRNVMFPWKIPLFPYLQGPSRWWLSCYGDGFVCFRGPSGHFYKDKELLVLNPLFPHEWKTLTLPAESESLGLLGSAIAFDRKIGSCKLIFWGKISEDRIVTFVFTFKEGKWKTIKGCNGSSKHFLIRGSAQLVNERFLCWLGTDLFAFVTKVLVFDAEEEIWREPIPLGKGSFICIVQHEKQMCVTSRRYEKKETIFELWKVDLKQRILTLLECIPPIPPPTTGKTEYRGGPRFFEVDDWSSGIFRVEEWNINENRYRTWVYDISNHSWQYLGHLGLGHVCFEGSLFRLDV